MSGYLSSRARKALAVYAATDDDIRERLARVRRLRPNGTVRHWTWASEPPRLRQTMQAGRFLWSQMWGDRAARAEEVHKLAAAQATLRNPHLKRSDPLVEWTPVMQAADLEAQAIIGALTLRDKGSQITDEQFDILTAAWRKAGLPL